MNDPRTAWGDVADRMSALCLKLKLHAQEELSDEELRSKSGLDRLAATIDEMVDAIEDAYEDEAVRTDAREVGRSFVAAIDSTIKAATERVRST